MRTCSIADKRLLPFRGTSLMASCPIDLFPLHISMDLEVKRCLKGVNRGFF